MSAITCQRLFSTERKYEHCLLFHHTQSKLEDEKFFALDVGYLLNMGS
jgi:hypothetical protein